MARPIYIDSINPRIIIILKVYKKEKIYLKALQYYKLISQGIKMELPKEIMIKLYSDMLKIRFFEERCAELAAQGKLPANPHLCTGQEASIVGVCANLRKDDYLIGTHRNHGHNIAKGGSLKKIMAEIFGKATGYCRGKAGTMHVAAYDVNVLGCFAVVGDGIPFAAGVALAAKMKKTGRVVACFFGDGATNTGAFAEGVNLAAIWKLPVIFICENNLYAITTRITQTSLLTNLSDKAVAFGIPAFTVDGNDVLAVYEVAKEAIERARRGEGPTLIETKTYRWRGSSEGDPMRGLTYRSKEELDEWMKRCPIKMFRTKLLSMGLLTDEEDLEIRENILKEIEDAINFAMDSPYPALEEALKDVYA